MYQTLTASINLEWTVFFQFYHIDNFTIQPRVQIFCAHSSNNLAKDINLVLKHIFHFPIFMAILTF